MTTDNPIRPASPRASDPMLPNPTPPVVLIPREDAARAASEAADAVDSEWSTKLRKLARDFDRESSAARARSFICPKSHADGWIERMETYRKCAAEVRRLLGE